jgi:hypothetical protein
VWSCGSTASLADRHGRGWSVHELQAWPVLDHRSIHRSYDALPCLRGLLLDPSTDEQEQGACKTHIRDPPMYPSTDEQEKEQGSRFLFVSLCPPEASAQSNLQWPPGHRVSRRWASLGCIIFKMGPDRTSRPNSLGFLGSRRALPLDHCTYY